MIPSASRAIGGYFELELSRHGTVLHEGALRFQSSRAGFLTLLRALRPRAVWMPWYICDAMIEPLRMTRTPIKRYEIGADLRPRSIELAQGEWLVYVNYFGLCASQIDDVLACFPRDEVVIDNAQALFAEPKDCLATLYSPRKFVGVPDGGYLVTRQRINAPTEIDQKSLQRSAHLLQRLAHDAESGYADYVIAEESLREQEPLQMSALTCRMLSGINYESVRDRRIENFAFLHEKLQRHNRLALSYRHDAVPLCYPFFGAPLGLREALRAQRVYTPTYWPDIEKMQGVPDFERSLSTSTLFLPCDQRVTPEDLAPIVQYLLDRIA